MDTQQNTLHHPTRRTLMTATAMALTTPHIALSAPRISDPAVAAFRMAAEAEAASIAAYEAADEAAPKRWVEVPLALGGVATAFSAAQIDQTIEAQSKAAAFHGAHWIDPTPRQIQRTEYISANPYAADADAIKAELRARERRYSDVFRAAGVDEKNAICSETRQVVIDTPATTMAGIAAKLRLAVGPDAEVEPGEALSELVFSALADAERLAAADGYDHRRPDVHRAGTDL